MEGSLLGAATFGGYWSLGWPSASHRGFLCNKYLRITKILLHTMWTLSSPATTRKPTLWVWCGGCWAGVVPLVQHYLVWTPMRCSLLLQRPWRDWTEKAGCCQKGCDQGGISGWTDFSTSEFTATKLKAADWAEGAQVPMVPIQCFPTKD